MNKDQILDGSEFVDFIFANSKQSKHSHLSEYFPYERKEKALENRYFQWPDIVHGGFTFSGIALRITENDVCTITLVARQNSRFYTHLANRIAWTAGEPGIRQQLPEFQ